MFFEMFRLILWVLSEGAVDMRCKGRTQECLFLSFFVQVCTSVVILQLPAYS